MGTWPPRLFDKFLEKLFDPPPKFFFSNFQKIWKKSIKFGKFKIFFWKFCKITEICWQILKIFAKLSNIFANFQTFCIKFSKFWKFQWKSAKSLKKFAKTGKKNQKKNFFGVFFFSKSLLENLLDPPPSTWPPPELLVILEIFGGGSSTHLLWSKKTKLKISF